MNVIKYDEPALVQRLAKLPRNSAVVFALCCATRQMSAFEAYAEKFAPAAREVPLHLVDELWKLAGLGESDSIPWAEQLAILEALFPGEQHHWAPLHVYGENALYSLTYTIRYLLTNDPQEAAYAARLAYEAADQAALRLLDNYRDSPDIEELVISSEVVQRELRRQAEDLRALETNTPGTVLQLKILAFKNRLLTEHEMLA